MTDTKKVWLVILSALVLLMFVFPIYKANDCYAAYVVECNDCHLRGGAYSLCSGACYEGINVSYACVTAMDQTCEDAIPHNYCVVNNGYWCYGLFWCLR